MKTKLFASTFFTLICMVLLSTNLMGQVSAADTIYLKNGNKIPVVNPQVDIQNQKLNYVEIKSSKLKSRELKQVYGFTRQGEFQLLASYTDFQGQLRENLKKAHEQKRIGSSFIVAGMVLGWTGAILREVEHSKNNESLNPDDLTDAPKFLLYAGAGLATIGWSIRLNANKYLKQATIQVGPAGMGVKIDL